MSATAWASLAGVVLAGLIGGLWWTSGVDQHRQREILAKYLPEAQCDAATFALVEDERGMRGNGYDTLSTRDPACVRSIRDALTRRGSRETYVAETLAGWNIPGRDRLASGGDVTFQGPVLNLFLFRPDGTLLWQRYSQ